MRMITVYEPAAPEQDIERPYRFERRTPVDPTLEEAEAMNVNWRDGDAWHTARLHEAPLHVLASEAQRWQAMHARFPDAPAGYGYHRYYRACELVLESRRAAA